ncbi:uncharacterized membrane protein YbaN (DUF454 family) [Pararhizobium capsulatum DSM 1112]|uniref:Uncharacterized membrane protein YbaN (DUF454 family) n=1 Tax=Pararhizobium capsulatum DSM 1112 TaxID=1121113 RepID=A0ABU0BWA2_9HYPH|nr:YbaN family protein [Pararhizobium capsulatum]MDQ0322529.1 uncharacterized membrane protein YbaN (DUF454 family) [Pararhizobium capsulatum DSM 1112]
MTIRRRVYLVLGWVLVAIGVVGAFLPLLPTTPFLLLAIWLFARSSPKMESWLFNHPRFGPGLRTWRDERAIPTRAKALAVIMIAGSYALMWFTSHPSPMVAIVTAAILCCSALFILTRNSPTQK